MRYGAQIDPPNRFESITREPDLDQLAWDREFLETAGDRPVEYLPDDAQSIVSENDSPDVAFRYSVNPYRGCLHGCAYCYARPYHEYLGFSAGIDFETKILVKHRAPQLLREFLGQSSWQPETIAFSGVTDCYQPAEREFRLTRQCLEVAREACQPISIITKNALVCRDLDLLGAMARHGLAQVSLSVTTLNPELARLLEPKTSIPAARLRAIGLLAEAGVPVRVLVAPVIPGLNDREIPAILQAAREAGARSARYLLLRLPLTVEPVFRDWLRRAQPLGWQRIEGLIRDTRQGRMNCSEFGTRMSGAGPLAAQIGQVFEVFTRKLGLEDELPPLDGSQFRPPRSASGQRYLF